MTHSAHATPALRALTEADPALAALSLWCAHRDHAGPTETVGTEIRYGPGFATLPLHEQIGVVGHHILHVALQHSARMAAMAARFPESFAPDLWQIAADAIVNEALVQAGHALPRPALLLTGLLAAVDGTSPPPAEALAAWDSDRLYLRLAGGQGGEGGRARAHAKAQGHGADLQPEPGAGASEERAADWRAHLARALAAGAAAGFGIGTLGHRLADWPRPRVPWEWVLRRLLLRAMLSLPQPSHRRPARAWLAAEAMARATGGPVPAFQPGVARAREVPRLALCLDCSTSIDPPRMALFMGEIAGICRRMGAEAYLLTFDEVVHHQMRLDAAGWRAQLAALELPQGGGTDFRPVIGAALRLRPSAIVLLTDLDGPTGPDPRLPVIWAVPEAPLRPEAPFGHVLSLAH